MAENANQHFVPKFYFRYFSRDSKSINVLLRQNGRTIPHASIKGQASRRYFYGGSKAEQLLEIADSVNSQVFNEVRSARSIDEIGVESWLRFLQNMLLQRARTLAARLAGQPMMDRMMQLQLEVLINNKDDISPEEKRELLRSLPNIGANEQQTQALQMSTAVEISSALADLVPMILENRTPRPFIFSDAPVVLLNLLYRKVKLRGVLGTDTPGLMVYYPMSPSRALLLLDGCAYTLNGTFYPGKAIRKLRDIAALNKLQIHSGVNAIYFSDITHAPYVQDLWHQESARLSAHAGRVVEAPGLDQDGEQIGDIAHSFQPQLAFLPKLSFVQYPEVEEHEYKFSRRTSLGA